VNCGGAPSNKKKRGGKRGKKREKREQEIGPMISKHHDSGAGAFQGVGCGYPSVVFPQYQSTKEGRKRRGGGGKRKKKKKKENVKRSVGKRLRAPQGGGQKPLCPKIQLLPEGSVGQQTIKNGGENNRPAGKGVNPFRGTERGKEVPGVIGGLKSIIKKKEGLTIGGCLS